MPKSLFLTQHTSPPPKHTSPQPLLAHHKMLCPVTAGISAPVLVAGPHPSSLLSLPGSLFLGAIPRADSSSSPGGHRDGDSQDSTFPPWSSSWWVWAGGAGTGLLGGLKVRDGPRTLSSPHSPWLCHAQESLDPAPGVGNACGNNNSYRIMEWVGLEWNLKPSISTPCHG